MEKNCHDNNIINNMWFLVLKEQIRNREIERGSEREREREREREGERQGERQG